MKRITVVYKKKPIKMDIGDGEIIEYDRVVDCGGNSTKEIGKFIERIEKATWEKKSKLINKYITFVVK